MTRRKFPDRRKRGLGLLGAVLTVTVMTVSLAGVFSVYRTTIVVNERASVTLDLMGAMAMSVRKAHSGGMKYGEKSALQDIALAGASMRLKSSAAVTPWGGAVIVFAGDDIAKTTADAPEHTSRFILQVAGLPARACEIVAGEMVHRSEVVTVHVGTTEVADVNAISTSCSGASSTVSVTFSS
ncbi:MAG: hypothetical protein F4213_11830 [Boseongicola sp. SB0677_bin_26]|nr:hypothetical protein [Boseongicola sp. SB0665_bin_10]MYG26695.1 hypothetical protein [Boseongicola sp. SB0677_bin_26]